jgi:hypothetical protein
MWIETAEDGQYLNAKLVERFSVERLETDTELCVITAYMPSGRAIQVSREPYPSFHEGVNALKELTERVTGE